MNLQNVKLGLRDPDLVEGWDINNVHKQPKKD
jgi:hypothetical protein